MRHLLSYCLISCISMARTSIGNHSLLFSKCSLQTHTSLLGILGVVVVAYHCGNPLSCGPFPVDVRYSWYQKYEEIRPQIPQNHGQTALRWGEFVSRLWHCPLISPGRHSQQKGWSRANLWRVTETALYSLVPELVRWECAIANLFLSNSKITHWVVKTVYKSPNFIPSASSTSSASLN